MRRCLQVLTAAMLVWLCAPDSTEAAGDPLVFAVQEALLDEGYDPGWPDGVLGPKTRSAIRALEADFAMPLTGNVTPGLVELLGLAAYASELGVMQFDGFRSLAPPGRTAGAVQMRDASYDADAVPPAPRRDGRPAVAETWPSVPKPQFQVRETHPLLAKPAQPQAGSAPSPAAPQPASRPQPGETTAAHASPATPSAAEPNPPENEVNPTAAGRFAPRNWLIRDFPEDGAFSRPAFGVFLEEGGKAAGPRFAGRLRWHADGNRFTMTYRNSIGQEIERTGWLHGLNRIEGEATGPGGRTWRWLAEAKPL